MRIAVLISAAFALVSSTAALENIPYTVTCPTVYVVKNGDTCSSIGKAFHINTSKIKKWNPSINARCTNLYIDEILCLSKPTISTKVIQTTPKVLTMPNAGPECIIDSDCAGARCCDTSNNKCVLDPHGVICDRKKSAVTTLAQSSPKPTTAAHRLVARACVSGSKGLGNGDGYNGYCCSTSDDCWDTCISGVCNGPYNTKTTTKASTTTTKTSTATTAATCVSGSKGLKRGDGYNGYCCSSSDDCWDTCISGVCNGPYNTKTTTTTKTSTTTKSSTTTTKSTTTTTTTKSTTTTTKTSTSTAAATCVSGSKGLKRGDGYNGYCCSSSDDCWDTCINGVCNGPYNTKTTTTTKTTTKASTTTTGTATSTSTPTNLPTYPSGLTVQISSSQDFCLFLPSKAGVLIADSEKNAHTYCTTTNANAPGAYMLPSGFIKTATYQTNTTAGFRQVRGTMDNKAFGLVSSDEGGQYDNHGSGSPPNSVCAGYPYYVSLIEPTDGVYCIRCCEVYSDCNAGRSAYGCDRVVPFL